MRSTHWPCGGILGVSFITMHLLGIILYFLSFSLSLSLSCFEMRILQVSCLFVVQGFLTSSDTRLPFWHTFLCIRYPHTPNGLLMFVQRCQNVAEGNESAQKLHWSLVFISRPCQACFIFNNHRESPPSLRLVFLWRWSRAERENAVGKVLARSDLLAGGGVIPLSLGLSEIWAVDVWRSLIYSRSACFLHDLNQRCFFLRRKSRELVSRFNKRVDVFFWLFR